MTNCNEFLKMSNREKLLFGIWTLLVFLVYGCENHANTTPVPDIGLPDSEMNTRIRLQAPDGWNTLKIGDVVGIDVEVISDDQIAFSHDYGAKIFIYEDQEWREIPNLMKYPDGYLLLTDARGDVFKKGVASVAPVLPKTDKAVLMRIILIGNIYRNGQITTEQTAAYIDLELKP